MRSPMSAQSAAVPAADFRDLPVHTRMRRDFVTLDATDSLAEALSVMRLARLRHVPITSGGRLAGLLSYRSLQDAAIDRLCGRPGEGDPLADATVASAMQASPVVLDPDDPLAEAAEHLCALRLGCLPVVERTDAGMRVVGLVTESDLLTLAFRR